MEDIKPSEAKEQPNRIENHEITKNPVTPHGNDSTKIEQNQDKSETGKADDPEPILHFKCELCHLDETYDHYGKIPPWSTKTVLLENAYICKDPFTMPHKRQILILGSKCSMCDTDVCAGPKCSFFFSKRFCRHCALRNITYFPTQIQMKMNKNFSS